MSFREQIGYRLPDVGIHSGGWPARLFGLAIGFLGWYGLATIFPNELMPYPIETLVITGELVQSGDVWGHLSATLWRVLWGFVGSMAVGIAFGVLMGSSNYGRAFLTPFILIGLAIPAIAWAGISFLIFRFGTLTPVVATVAVTFPFVAINVWKGVEDVDWPLIEMSKSFGVSNRRILARSVIPDTAGALLTATRFGLAISWKIVTIAEMFAGSEGVGYKLVQAYNAYLFEEAWAWAILFMIVILFIEYALIQPLERRVYAYRNDTDFTRIA